MTAPAGRREPGTYENPWVDRPGLLDVARFGIDPRKPVSDGVLDFGATHLSTTGGSYSEPVTGVGPGNPVEVILTRSIAFRCDVEGLPVDLDANRRSHLRLFVHLRQGSVHEFSLASATPEVR